jgi:hypothetical protein
VCRQCSHRKVQRKQEHNTTQHNTIHWLALLALLHGNENRTVKARDTRRITAEEIKYFRIIARYNLDSTYNKYID